MNSRNSTYTGYAKSKDGLIHLVSAINSEFTLCGNAFDGESGDSDDGFSWIDCKKQKITCRQCIAEISSCLSARNEIPK
jgi:hypothetical protein